MYSKSIISALAATSVLLAGCASTQSAPLTEGATSQFDGKTMTVAARDYRPEFTAQTASIVVNGGLSGETAYSQGNTIVSENNIEDPADYVSEIVAEAIAARHGVVVASNGGRIVSDEDVIAIAGIYKQADYVLDIRTLAWGFVYFPTDWNNYRIQYGAELRVIDTKARTLIAKGICSRLPRKTPEAPSYDELLTNNAERLKAELVIAADHCVEQFKLNVLRYYEM